MIIDLSLPIGEDTPRYPGDPEISIRLWAVMDRDGYYMNVLKMGEHSGTHVDAPAHFLPEGKTVDEMPLESFMGEGIVVDLRGREGEVLLEELPEVDVGGRIVLLLTGGRGLSPEVAQFLVDEGVRAVGTDGMSIGDEIVHRIFLGNEVPIFENLVNLDLLIGLEFTFIGFPLKIEGGSGSPVRAVAIVHGEE
jgi:kynurenine formamidase